jgi:hypothetical protein
MPDLEWDRQIFNIGEARVEIVRERLIDDFYEDDNDFFDRFN